VKSGAIGIPYPIIVVARAEFAGAELRSFGFESIRARDPKSRLPLVHIAADAGR
jgi:hypothetical protein